MKKISITFLFVILLASCAAQPTALGEVNNNTTNNQDTITIRIETPFYVLDSPAFTTLLEHTGGPIYLPIKSYRVLNNVGNAQISFVDLDSDQELTLKQEHYKYSDKSKYSTLQFETKNQYFNSKYGNNYIDVLYVVLELDIYKDEITSDSLKKFEAEAPENRFFQCLDTCFVLQNNYSGGVNAYTKQNTRSLEKESYSKMITDTLDSIYYSYLEDFVLHDDSFAKAAAEIKSTFKSNNAFDKAKAITDWISKNIEYDSQLVDLSIDNQNPIFSNTSARNALINKKTICVGYAHLYNALARYFDIESYIVYGTGGSEEDIKNKIQHAWNISFDENDKIIYVDATFAASGTQQPNYWVVCAPNEQFEKTHYVWSTGEKKYIPFAL